MTPVEILGTRVDRVTASSLRDVVRRWVDEQSRGYICCANVHVIEISRRAEELRDALSRADVVVPDGAPIAWLASRGGRRVDRVTGSDVFETLCADAHVTRHFLYGATESTLAVVRDRIERSYPHATVVGTHAPPFRPLTDDERRRIARTINEARPHVVWVGLGAPKQELWMAQMRPLLLAPALVGVGAVFDFYSGNKRRAPRAVQRAGLEWAFRLVQEPLRLGKRYVTTNTSFVVALAGETLRRPVR